MKNLILFIFFILWNIDLYTQKINSDSIYLREFQKGLFTNLDNAELLRDEAKQNHCFEETSTGNYYTFQILVCGLNIMERKFKMARKDLIKLIEELKEYKGKDALLKNQNLIKGYLFLGEAYREEWIELLIADSCYKEGLEEIEEGLKKYIKDKNQIISYKLQQILFENNRGEVAFGDTDNKEAQKVFHECLDKITKLKSEIANSDTSNMAFLNRLLVIIHGNLGGVYEEIGQIEDAKENYKKSCDYANAKAVKEDSYKDYLQAYQRIITFCEINQNKDTLLEDLKKTYQDSLYRYVKTHPSSEKWLIYLNQKTQYAKSNLAKRNKDNEHYRANWYIVIFFACTFILCGIIILLVKQNKKEERLNNMASYIEGIRGQLTQKLSKQQEEDILDILYIPSYRENLFSNAEVSLGLSEGDEIIFKNVREKSVFIGDISYKKGETDRDIVNCFINKKTIYKEENARISGLSPKKGESPLSYLYLPIIIIKDKGEDKECIGVLALQWFERCKFSSNDIPILQSFASTLGAFIMAEKEISKREDVLRQGKKESAKLITALDNCNSGIMLVYEDGKIDWKNKIVANHYPDKVDVSTLFEISNYPWIRKKFEDAINNGNSFYQHTFNKRRFNVTLNKVLTDDGVRLIVVDTDITQIYEFIKMLGHDLKTPLTTPKMILENMLKRHELKNIYEELNLILASINIGLHYSSSIEVYGKLATHTFEDIRNYIDIDEFVKEIYAFNEPALHFYNIKFETKKGKKNSINVNKLVTQTIVNNLISNALKACDDNKENKFIQLTINTVQDYIEFIVEDNGIGIEKSLVTKFNHGEMLDNSIGLKMMRDYIRQIKGSYVIESIEGHYTKITLHVNNTSEG